VAKNLANTYRMCIAIGAARLAFQVTPGMNEPLKIRPVDSLLEVKRFWWRGFGFSRYRGLSLR
jgi:hypothetical protein